MSNKLKEALSYNHTDLPTNKITNINNNLINDSLYKNIIKSNENYVKKMNKSTKNILYSEITKNELNHFITQDLKSLKWKSIPIHIKISKIIEFINNDNDLQSCNKEKYIELVNLHFNTISNKFVEYNNNSIETLKYKYLESLPTI
jgi:hypothetical protein